MKALVVLAAVVVTLGLAACSDGGDSSGDEEAVSTTTVDLPKSYRFEPATIRIGVGDTVTWTNNDDFPHNVHLLDGSDRTVDLPIGESAEITFLEAGEVSYECSIHPQQMKGTVVVEGR